MDLEEAFLLLFFGEAIIVLVGCALLAMSELAS